MQEMPSVARLKASAGGGPRIRGSLVAAEAALRPAHLVVVVEHGHEVLAQPDVRVLSHLPRIKVFWTCLNMGLIQTVVTPTLWR